MFKGLITDLPGFPSLCIFGCMQKNRVLGDSTFSPSETLLLINLSFLNLVITLLTVALFSGVGSCSKCLYCSVSFRFFNVVFYIKCDFCAFFASFFATTISSLSFSSSNAFSSFLDRLVYLQVRLILSSSLIRFFAPSMKLLIVIIFVWSPLFLGCFFKEFLLLFVFVP